MSGRKGGEAPMGLLRLEQVYCREPYIEQLLCLDVSIHWIDQRNFF